MTAEPSLPAFIEPMLATRGQPFDSQHYLFEIKWDGIRMLAFIEEGSYRLMNRHGVNTTERYPEFAFLAGLAPGTILDGEMVVLRQSGPDFALIQSRDKTRSPLKIRTLSRTQPATYIVFDLLYENLVPLLDLPWRQRRQRLENLLQQERDPHLVLSQAMLGQGRALFAETCRQGLEGIMAKHVSSRYQPGRRSRDWLKIKPQTERNGAKDR
jgi:ATP-dependent DNA ligase